MIQGWVWIKCLFFKFSVGLSTLLVAASSYALTLEKADILKGHYAFANGSIQKVYQKNGKNYVTIQNKIYRIRLGFCDFYNESGKKLYRNQCKKNLPKAETSPQSVKYTSKRKLRNCSDHNSRSKSWNSTHDDAVFDMFRNTKYGLRFLKSNLPSNEKQKSCRQWNNLDINQRARVMSAYFKELVCLESGFDSETVYDNKTSYGWLQQNIGECSQSVLFKDQNGDYSRRVSFRMTRTTVYHNKTNLMCGMYQWLRLQPASRLRLKPNSKSTEPRITLFDGKSDRKGRVIIPGPGAYYGTFSRGPLKRQEKKIGQVAMTMQRACDIEARASALAQGRDPGVSEVN